MRARKLQAVRIDDVTIPEDYDLHEDGISQSLLGAFQSCPLRFLLMINRWQLVGGDAVFVFGNIYHEMLDQSFQAGKAPSNAVLKGRLKRYSKKEEKKLSEVALEDFGKKLKIAEMILQEYYQYYDDEYEKVQVIEPEQNFDVEFHGYRLRGKKDLRFMLGKSKAIWLMEHKTKGRVDADVLEDVLDFDLQNLFYTTADDVEYQDDVQNVLYNIIRNPGHKKNKSETFEEYVERIREHIQRDPAHFFIRYNCTYNAKNKNRFATELKDKLDLIDMYLEGALPFWRNECACRTPFKCPYLGACASGKLAGYVQQETMFPELEE
jgi:hypothetical protein